MHYDILVYTFLGSLVMFIQVRQQLELLLCLSVPQCPNRITASSQYCVMNVNSSGSFTELQASEMCYKSLTSPPTVYRNVKHLQNELYEMFTKFGMSEDVNMNIGLVTLLPGFIDWKRGQLRM